MPVQEMKVRIRLHYSQPQTMASRRICSLEADEEDEMDIEGGKQQNPALVSTAFWWWENYWSFLVVQAH